MLYDSELDNEIELSKDKFDKEKFLNAINKGAKKYQAAKYRSLGDMLNKFGVDNNLKPKAQTLQDESNKLDSTGYDEVEYLTYSLPGFIVSKATKNSMPAIAMEAVSTGYGNAKNSGKDYGLTETVKDTASLKIGNTASKNANKVQKVLEQAGRGDAGIPFWLTQPAVGFGSYQGSKLGMNELTESYDNYPKSKSINQILDDFYRQMIYESLFDDGIK